MIAATLTFFRHLYAMRTRLTEMLHLEHPLIMAPMFLVSNTALVKEGPRDGIAGCIPALNYRTLKELRAAGSDREVRPDRCCRKLVSGSA